MISIEAFFETDSDSDSDSDSVDLKVKRKRIRDFSNPLEIDHTRLNKQSFADLLREIDSKLHQQQRLTAVPNIIKLAAVLRFFGEGGYQQGTATDFNLGLAQPTFSLIFKEVCDVMENFICPKWITTNYSEQEKIAAKRFFFEKCNIPGVIGCVDGTHIKLIKPKESVQHLFYNRKGFHSINAMIMCDHKMQIRYINAKNPGASHDSFVWNASALKRKLKADYDSEERNTWLLGDSGYPLEVILMTPYRSPTEGSAESAYNSFHSKGRNIIERTIGILKNRFRCLLGARQLHYSPEKATKIINICSALHNICIYYKCQEPDENAARSDEVNDTSGGCGSEEESTEARVLRERIVQSLI